MRKCVIILILICQQVLAQDKELTIGDQMPPTRFTEVVNYPKPVIEPEDTKGKIVLYDFWSTWCGSCVASMPKMAELQKEFEDNLKVILVTYEDQKVVDRFYSKRPEFKALGLPIVTKDSIMIERFPYRMVPHVVWVGKDGIVKAITSGDNVSKENVVLLQKQNKIGLPLKRDVVDFDYEAPFTSLPEMQASNALRQSFLTAFVDGLSSRDGFTQPDGQHTRIYFTNIPLLGMIYAAVEDEFAPGNRQYYLRAIIETKDDGLLRYENSLEERMKQCFCYDAIIPVKDSRQARQLLRQKMMADIEEAFGWNIELTERKTACYILKETSAGILTQPVDNVEAGVNVVAVKNASIKSLATQLCGVYAFDKPLLYDTGLRKKYSVHLSKEYKLLSDLQTALNSAGLEIVADTRMLKMLRIMDKESQPE